VKRAPARDPTAIAPGAPVPGAMAFPGGAAALRTAPADPGAMVSPASAARRRFGLVLVLATLFLIFAGAEVKSRQAGLSVPDWPLSYGMVWPPMVGNVFYEHGHRAIAAAVGMLVTLMAVWTARTEPRRWVAVLAWSALGAVVAQGVLGGLTVIFLLPPAISISHGILAQTLLCLLTWLAFATSREWAAPRATGRSSRSALTAAACAAGAVYVQLVLGALMRHNEAGLAVPFFPVSPAGAWLPDVVDLPVVLHMLHRGFAVVVLALVLLAARRVALAHARLARHAYALAVLACTQVLLGASIIWTARRDPDTAAWVKFPVPASLHVLLGAGLLATAWWLCLRCWHAPEHAPELRAERGADVADAAGAAAGPLASAPRGAR